MLFHFAININSLFIPNQLIGGTKWKTESIYFLFLLSFQFNLHWWLSKSCKENVLFHLLAPKFPVNFIVEPFLYADSIPQPASQPMNRWIKAIYQSIRNTLPAFESAGTYADQTGNGIGMGMENGFGKCPFVSFARFYSNNRFDFPSLVGLDWRQDHQLEGFRIRKGHLKEREKEGHWTENKPFYWRDSKVWWSMQSKSIWVC